MTTIPTFSSEVISMGLDAYEKNTSTIRSFIHPVTGATDAVVQFLNNPWDSPTDWINLREIWATNGLKSGDRMPPGLGVFPAVDREERISPQTGKPCMVVINDPLIDLVRPGQYDKNGKAGPRNVTAVNAVFLSGSLARNETYNPLPGEFVVLKFSAKMGLQLKEKFLERRDENADFDATTAAWRIGIQGTGVTAQLILRKEPDQALLADGVEPMDLTTLFGEIRSDAEQAIAAMGSGVAASASSVNMEPEHFTDSGDDLVDNLEHSVAVLEDAGLVADDQSGLTFDGVSDARLRRLLVDAGVTVPRGAKRDALIQLATTHGVSAS